MKFKLSSDFECGMVAGYRLAGTVDLLGISYAIIFRIYREVFFLKRKCEVSINSLGENAQPESLFLLIHSDHRVRCKHT